MARTVPAAYSAIFGPLPIQQVITTDHVTEGQNQNFVAAYLTPMLFQQGLVEQGARWYIRESTTTLTTHCIWHVPKPATTYAAKTLTMFVWARVSGGTGQVTARVDATSTSVNVTATAWTLVTATVTLPATANDYYLVYLRLKAGAGESIDACSVYAQYDYASGTVPAADGGFVYLENDRAGANASLSVHREQLKAANCEALLTERLGMLIGWSDDYSTEGFPLSGRSYRAWTAYTAMHVVKGLPCRIGPGVDRIVIKWIGLVSAGTGTMRVWFDAGYDEAVSATFTNTTKSSTFNTLNLDIVAEDQARTMTLWVEIEPAASESAMITNFCAWEAIQ